MCGQDSPKDCQGWGGMAGAILSIIVFNFIWFALQLIILHLTELKYQFCNLFLKTYLYSLDYSKLNRKTI